VKSANWFERLANNSYVEVLMIADRQGRILRASRPLLSEQEIIASMFQALEVFAQTLTSEFQSGTASLIQLTTDISHLLLMPLQESTIFLIVQVERTAPLRLLMVELERTIAEITAADLAVLQSYPVLAEDPGGLDADELIAAVQEWLRSRPTSNW
jgi:predicted regulator of Ras-like GTPase activity (Roadblock/LC7/MglB family)